MCSDNATNRHSVNRSNAISIVRVMATFAIVLYHCMCYNAGIWNGTYDCVHINPHIYILARVIVSLTLPIFFFISGYVFALGYIEKNKYKAIIPLLGNKARRLLLPVVSYTVIYLLLFPYIDLNLTEFVSGIRHLWFLPTLFLCFVIVYPFRVLLTFNKHLHKGIIGGALVILLCYLSCNAQVVFRYLSFPVVYNMCKYLVFFVLGVLTYKSMQSLNIKLLLITILLMLSLAFHYKLMWSGGLVIQIVDTLSICLFCCMLLLYFNRLNLKESTIIKLNNRHSMGIYLIHQILIMAIYEYTTFEEQCLVSHPYYYIPLLFVGIYILSLSYSVVKNKLRFEPYL